MRLARVLRLCVAAQRNRSTRGSQGQRPRKTKPENSPLWIQKCTIDDAMQVYRALREVGAGTGGVLTPLLP
jgi:hypothetical protein